MIVIKYLGAGWDVSIKHTLSKHHPAGNFNPLGGDPVHVTN